MLETLSSWSVFQFINLPFVEWTTEAICKNHALFDIDAGNLQKAMEMVKCNDTVQPELMWIEITGNNKQVLCIRKQ